MSVDRIAIVIVNWNTGGLLEECLQSIAQFADGTVESVTVVDNASTDDSIEFPPIDGLPTLRVIRNATNEGFAHACNIGADGTTSEYLLFLNPDTRIEAGTLRGVLNDLSTPECTDVGIAGVRLVDDDGLTARCCSRFLRPTHVLAGALGLTVAFPSLGHQMVEFDHSHTRAVDHVIGAFFLVRRRVFDSLRGFDVRFFVYLEDVDFSLRARSAGWRSMYFADHCAFHMGGGASRNVIARRLFYSLRSRLLYSRKHFGLVGHSVVIATTMLIEPMTRIANSLVIRGSIADLRDTCRACWWLCGWLLQSSLCHKQPQARCR